MVTCQSANQLKTPAQFSWAFKMVSQFGSLGFTIMGKTADLTVVQLTIIESQTFIAKKAGCSQSAVSKHVNRKLSGRKNSQPTERTAALWGLSSKIDTRIWVNFTRNGLRLGSRHQEPRHTDVSRNLATVVVFLLLSHSWTTDNVRGVLPGLRRRRTGLLPSGPKSSFEECVKHYIRLSNFKPFRERSRRIAPIDTDDVRRNLKDLLAAGIIKVPKSLRFPKYWLFVKSVEQYACLLIIVHWTAERFQLSTLPHVQMTCWTVLQEAGHLYVG